MSADGKAPGRGIGSLGWPDGANVRLNKRGVAQRSVGLDGEHGETATAIIGDKNKLSERIDAQVGGPPALRAHDIEEGQVTG